MNPQMRFTQPSGRITALVDRGWSPLRLLALLAVCLAWSPAEALAQMGAGTLVGHVRKGNGEAAAGAEVAIHRVDTNEAFLLLANANGNYRRGGLPPGQYEITATLEGFETQVRTHIQLLVEQIREENFLLLPGDSGIRHSTRSGAVLAGSGREDRGSAHRPGKVGEHAGQHAGHGAVGQPCRRICNEPREPQPERQGIGHAAQGQPDLHRRHPFHSWRRNAIVPSKHRRPEGIRYQDRSLFRRVRHPSRRSDRGGHQERHQ